MKIAVVTPWYGEFAGGAEVLARKAAENLAKVGLDVEIFTTCSRSPFDSWWENYYKPGKYESENIIIRRFAVNGQNQKKYTEINFKLIHDVQISRDEELEYLQGSINSDDLISFAESKKEEYFFILTPYYYGLTYWLFNALPERCILVPCLHNEPQAYFSTTIEMLQKCPILFNTPEELSLARKICDIPEYSHVVCGVGVDIYTRFEKERFLKKYGIDYQYLLYTGRKDRGKNVDMLIEYFNEYKKREKDDLGLIFIGGGDRSLIPESDYIVDLGYVSEADKYNAYSGALGTCLLSDNESFSFVLMESWLASRPVIVSGSCPVTKGHCLRSNGGLFVENADEFCEVVKYLKVNPSIGEKMGRNGKEYVLCNYTWDIVVQKYLKMIVQHTRG